MDNKRIGRENIHRMTRRISVQDKGNTTVTLSKKFVDVFSQIFFDEA
jgi:hypothetical protein